MRRSRKASPRKCLVSSSYNKELLGRKGRGRLRQSQPGRRQGVCQALRPTCALRGRTGCCSWSRVSGEPPGRCCWLRSRERAAGRWPCGCGSQSDGKGKEVRGMGVFVGEIGR